MNKGVRNAYLRSIQRKVRFEVKDEFIGVHKNVIPMKDAVRAFCAKNSLTIPSSIKLNDWLITLYLDESCDLIQRNPQRNYTSSEWLKVCDKIYSLLGRNCLRCGSSENISMDHIKPYSKYPELALNEDNLQPLCRSCNSSKGNRLTTDFRQKQ